MNATYPEFIELSQLRPGPIRNESLPHELLEHVKSIYDVGTKLLACYDALGEE